MASSSPIPLYNTYRAEQGFTNADISLTVVAYFLGTITALLVLGRLSGHVGRRPTAIATLALLALGCLELSNVESIGWLVAGRLLMGAGAHPRRSRPRCSGGVRLRGRGRSST